jgi:RHS repeat-associated protein
MIEKVLPGGEKWTYQWDGAGQLREVVRPDGEVVAFAYDALGRRVRKAFGGSATAYVWDGNDVVHEMRPGAELTTWEFEPETFAPVAKIEGDQRYGVVTDHLGTPLAMFDEAGDVAWKAQLDVYGAAQTDVMRAHCPWRWPGQYEDEETGLCYNRFRYYDAAIGRFIEQDPIRLEGSLNIYRYPRNPLSAFDPLGLSECAKLERYDGPKPKYAENPAHIPGKGLRPGKTPLPTDAEQVFKNAVPNDPVNPTAWFGKNSNGQIYRFSSSNDGTAHFSGIDGVGDGTRNLTNYALDRLEGK